MTQPSDPSVQRIGHDERQQAIEALGEHYAHGRLDLPEFEQRTTAASEAITVNDLAVLFRDLPEPNPMAPAAPQPFVAPAPPAVPVPPYAPVVPQQPTSDKSKIAAGVLQLLLPIGIGRFYTGHIGMAIAQFFLAFLGVGLVWCWVDGIVLLTSRSTDSEGRLLRG